MAHEIESTQQNELHVWDRSPDCEIHTIDEEILNAHKDNLSKVSDMLRVHFNGTLEHNNKIISNYDSEVMEVIRNFAYGCNFEFRINNQEDAEFIYEVFKAIDYYIMPELKDYCHTSLVSIYYQKGRNIWRLLRISYDFKLYILLNRCMKNIFRQTSYFEEKFICTCKRFKHAHTCIPFTRRNSCNYFHDMSYDFLLYFAEQFCVHATSLPSNDDPIEIILSTILNIIQAKLSKDNLTWTDLKEKYNLERSFKFAYIPLSNLKKFLRLNPNIFSSKYVRRAMMLTSEEEDEDEDEYQH